MKRKFLDLGLHPLANSFLSKKELKYPKKEYFYKLSVGFDTKSFLVSLMNTVNPKRQYTDKYAHRASQSATMNKSFINISNTLKKKFKPKISLEIGSNDGVFIKNFNKKKVIAVEPCKNLSRITKMKGFKTYSEFWTQKLARKILNSYKSIDLFFSANTISHIPNLKETFNAISLSLSKNGVLVIEDPYIGNILKSNSYDQFYDEHVYVFSLLSISRIINLSQLRIFDAETIPTHGGSMRYYICKNKAKFKATKRFKYLFLKEIREGIDKFSTYKKFSNRVKKSKKKLVNLLKNLKKGKKKIISYGATYKSTTVFNYCNIGKNYLDYVTDTTPNKQGRYTPGKHVPIISPKHGFNDSVDYAFLGAWNFEKEILSKERKFIKRGGRFITHVPKPRII